MSDAGSLPNEEAVALVRAIVGLHELAQRALPARSAFTDRVAAHLGLTGEVIPNTSRAFRLDDRVNFQLACDALAGEADRWETFGLGPEVGHYGGVSLTSVVAGAPHFPAEPTARQYEALPIGVDRTLACLRAGIVLAVLDGEPAAMMHHVSDRGMHNQLIVEVVARTEEVAERLLRRIVELMDELNVVRGQVVAFTHDQHGEYRLSFTAVPTVRREDVVLPAGTVDAIEAHALGISEHRAALLAVGQHVKRGLLLYGPPGTGKTHTVSYLITRTAGRTTVILSGSALHAIGRAGAIARDLQPATIVIEDVDLIGMERGWGHGDHNPLLFQLLNEMDGLAGDADVLFVLTTNRVDLLEPALAARPGRVDQAVEIGLPDADLRRRLIALYVPVALDDDLTDAVVARTDGVTASFVKELGRRIALLSISQDRPMSACVHEALDALLDQSAPILRATLRPGVGGPDRDGVDVIDAAGATSTSGWTAFAPPPD